MSRRRRSVTYRQAGVDVGEARRFVRAIRPLAARTRRPGLLQGIGGFGGLFRAGRMFPRDPVLVASADGVGTKLCLARRAAQGRWHGRALEWYRPLGVDLVAMNVNDLLCTGAEPLFFLDYIATGRLDFQVLLAIVRGIVAGCVESRCVLLGGETAQMGLLYATGDFDLAGFAVGVVGKASLVTGDRIRPGDRLLGLASSGLHSNGFSLVQKVLSSPEQRRLSRQLLRPTRIYVRPVLDVLRRGVPVHGIAHITGGSFREKLGRILPEGRSAVLRKGSWPVPMLFRRIQGAGVTETEMSRTFNLGIGMVLVLPGRAVPAARRILRRHALPSWAIGQIHTGNRAVIVQ